MWASPQQNKIHGREVCEARMYWMLRLRTKQATVNISIIFFWQVAHPHCAYPPCVCQCIYSHVGRRGTRCHNSLQQSSLVWAGWPSLYSHRTAPVSAVERIKGKFKKQGQHAHEFSLHILPIQLNYWYISPLSFLVSRDYKLDILQHYLHNLYLSVIYEWLWLLHTVCTVIRQTVQNNSKSQTWIFNFLCFKNW